MNIKVTNQDGLLNWRHINRNDVYRVDSCSTASDRVSWTRIDFDYDGVRGRRPPLPAHHQSGGFE